MAKIGIGERAPDFSAIATGNQTVTLSEFSGKNVVLYFYPKDNTPGCTRQAQAFNASAAKFAKQNTVVIGVSRDSLRSHDGFCSKYALNFPLISDQDGALCDLFGVIKPKTMFGKLVQGIERSTFLIDGAGTIRREWRGVKVDGHVDDVLAAVASLQNDQR